ncbi:hypothetical protein THUN1379_21100 [Paludibacterium sp. THUN1379]|uniref:hypothetical protein n=1 Tax=Paludibacterium sp. THUN1379 TaxID=3112107 RepID=UPI0030906D71|nr:hypothetical protein THUN1379_21100 [Paludibacterium sp. THUN1379]
MVEFLSRVIGALVPSVIKSVTDRSRLKIICYATTEINGDGVGTFLALGVKIINPTSTAIYFERLEVIDQTGESFFPSVYRLNAGEKIQPRRNVVGLVPCGHVTLKWRPRELRVYDSTERKHTIKGRMLKKAIEELETERVRLEDLNFSVHPTDPLPE